MARTNPITKIMETPLPSLNYQKRKLFRPSYQDVIYAYKIINRYIFDNALRRPVIEISQTKKCWGYCVWNPTHVWNGSRCIIRLTDKWFCTQWFMNTLAHEMVHQWQWDVYSWDNHLPQNSGGHGPSFFMWRPVCEYYNISLKTAHGQKRWFKHQNFDKC